MATRDLLIENVRRAMAQAGLNASQLADKADLYTSQLSLYLKGKKAASLEVIERMAGALGCEAWELIKPHAMDDQTLSEKELLAIFRRLNQKNQATILDVARGLDGKGLDASDQNRDLTKKLP